MTVVMRVRCDQCQRERYVEDPAIRCWYRVDRRVMPSFIQTDDGDCDSYDFCSMPCVAAWAATRELQQVTTSETRAMP